MRNPAFQSLSLLLIAVALVGRGVAPAGEVPPQESSERAIQYLVEFVAQSDWTFIRNGKEYSGQRASEHMVRKYKHFKDQIQSPEDFIRLAASKSLLSGQPYLVRNRQGEEFRSEDWLLEVLRQYRQARSVPESDARNPSE